MSDNGDPALDKTFTIKASKSSYEENNTYKYLNKSPVSDQALLESNVVINCPPLILQAFKEVIENNPKILGVKYTDAYTNQEAIFPSTIDELTPSHLQLLARNEKQNTTGAMQVELYNGFLSDDEIAMIRLLVKSVTISGVIYPIAAGGFPSEASLKLLDPKKTILVDQAGFQWQRDLRNSGCIFFYPNDEKDESLPKKSTPEKYKELQNKTYHALIGELRGECSKNTVDVNWNGVKGKIDLDKLALGIRMEFLQALDAFLNQATSSNDTTPPFFRYLKAGMGFFASGITTDATDVQIKLEETRLKGVLFALQDIKKLPEHDRDIFLRGLKGMDMPFSESTGKAGASDEMKTMLDAIQSELKAMNVEWGGANAIDVFSQKEGVLLGSPNCADGHTLIVNESNWGSVDAAIGSNAYVQHLNPGVNRKMTVRSQPDFSGRNIKINASTLTDTQREKNAANEKEALRQVKEMAVSVSVKFKAERELYQAQRDLAKAEDELEKSREKLTILNGSKKSDEAKYKKNINETNKSLIDILSEIKIHYGGYAGLSKARMPENLPRKNKLIIEACSLAGNNIPSGNYYEAMHELQKLLKRDDYKHEIQFELRENFAAKKIKEFSTITQHVAAITQAHGMGTLRLSIEISQAEVEHGPEIKSNQEKVRVAKENVENKKSIFEALTMSNLKQQDEVEAMHPPHH